MADEFKLFSIASSLIRNAGYHTDICEETISRTKRLVLIVQDPVMRSVRGGGLTPDGFREVKIYNNRGDSVLQGACRFIESRS